MERVLVATGRKSGREKLLELEHSFESSYLAFFIPIFSYKVRDKKYYPRKIYWGDTGFFYSVLGRKDYARLYENAVFLHLRRNQKILEQICYYKSEKDHEVDFLLRQGNEVKKLIQVLLDVNDEKTREREVRGLIAAAEDFKFDGELTIITRDYEGEEIVGGRKITYRKLWEFLLLKP